MNLNLKTINIFYLFRYRHKISVWSQTVHYRRLVEWLVLCRKEPEAYYKTSTTI